MKAIRSFLLRGVLVLIATSLGPGIKSAAHASAPELKQPPAMRVVDLKAPDGTILKASYFAAAKPGPGALLLHQVSRTRKEWDDLAAQLAAAGINVLTLDMRGRRERQYAL